MLVFEKVEGIIANCSNSYHFVIREIPLDGPEFHMLALELNGAAHFHGWIPSTHIRGPPTHAARWRRRPNARKHSFSGGINLIAPNPGVKFFVSEHPPSSRMKTHSSKKGSPTSKYSSLCVNTQVFDVYLRSYTLLMMLTYFHSFDNFSCGKIFTPLLTEHGEHVD